MMTLPAVFVTGVPRCGSSWIGDVQSTARRVRYNYEPFNPSRHPYLVKHHVYLGAGDHDPLFARAADSAVDVWRKRLTKDQIYTVCSVVAQFDLPFYRSDIDAG